MTVRPIPVVALVGRPNVGKSTLFNRLVGRRASLVDDRPGVTRDRLFGEGTFGGRVVRFVDTGGFDSDPDDPLLSRMREQTQLAIDEADLSLLVLDSQDGLRPADREVAQLLRRGGGRTLAVVNKLDHHKHDERQVDFYELGMDPVIGVSAEHGRGIGDLVEQLVEILDPPSRAELDAFSAPIRVGPDVEEGADEDPEAVDAEEEAGEPEGPVSTVEWDGGPIRVAVIGRPNVGKSSLVNRLLGETRMLATPIAGTTRDAVDAELERDGQAYVFVDTAGVRRRRSIADRLEKFSVMAAFRAIDRADVAVFVLDGAERPSTQDARVASLAHERGKGIVIVANKWDLVENPEWRDKFPEAVRHDLPFLDYAPILRLSAKTGRGVHKLFDAIMTVQKERHRRISTGALNRFLKVAVERHPPGLFKGKRAHLYFVSQPMVRPPTFVFTTRNPHNLSDAYARYLRNQLRYWWGFEGTPLWLKFRPRGKQKTRSRGKTLDQ